uniref:hypothetical protein n=1 Tax=Escherichia coli TaxID=562 RepID=UPI000BDF1F97
NCPLTDLGGKTSIFSHPVYLFLREFSLQDFRGGSEMWLFARQDFDDRVFTNPYEPVDLERVMTARKKYFTTSAEKQNANAAREKKQEAAE